MTALFSMGLDILILIALGVTIFYTVTLSKRLNAFRSQRKEFEGIVNELSANIARAQETVENLKQASLATGEQLHRKVKEAQLLQDEIEQILVSGENLADRLETSILGNNRTEEKTIKPQKKSEAVKPDLEDDLPGFLIHDLDHSEEEESEEGQSLWNLKDDAQDSKGPSRPPANTDEPFKSQAEIELMNALKRKNK
jgi:chromosome segregation ATPase